MSLASAYESLFSPVGREEVTHLPAKTTQSLGKWTLLEEIDRCMSKEIILTSRRSTRSPTDRLPDTRSYEYACLSDARNRDNASQGHGGPSSKAPSLRRVSTKKHVIVQTEVRTCRRRFCRSHLRSETDLRESRMSKDRAGERIASAVPRVKYERFSPRSHPRGDGSARTHSIVSHVCFRFPAASARCEQKRVVTRSILVKISVHSRAACHQRCGSSRRQGCFLRRGSEQEKTERRQQHSCTRVFIGLSVDAL